MPRTSSLTTTVSTKGQVILPKEIRNERRWPAGTQLRVENTPRGVLLTREPAFAPTRLEDVVGMLKYDGPPVSIESMDAAVDNYVRNRYGREYDHD